MIIYEEEEEKDDYDLTNEDLDLIMNSLRTGLDFSKTGRRRREQEREQQIYRLLNGSPTSSDDESENEQIKRDILLWILAEDSSATLQSSLLPFKIKIQTAVVSPTDINDTAHNPSKTISSVSTNMEDHVSTEPSLRQVGVTERSQEESNLNQSVVSHSDTTIGTPQSSALSSAVNTEPSTPTTQEIGKESVEVTPKKRRKIVITIEPKKQSTEDSSDDEVSPEHLKQIRDMLRKRLESQIRAYQQLLKERLSVHQESPNAEESLPFNDKKDEPSGVLQSGNTDRVMSPTGSDTASEFATATSEQPANGSLHFDLDTANTSTHIAPPHPMDEEEERDYSYIFESLLKPNTQEEDTFDNEENDDDSSVHSESTAVQSDDEMHVNGGLKQQRSNLTDNYQDQVISDSKAATIASSSGPIETTFTRKALRSVQVPGISKGMDKETRKTVAVPTVHSVMLKFPVKNSRPSQISPSRESTKPSQLPDKESSKRSVSVLKLVDEPLPYKDSLKAPKEYLARSPNDLDDIHSEFYLLFGTKHSQDDTKIFPQLLQRNIAAYELFHNKVPIHFKAPNYAKRVSSPSFIEDANPWCTFFPSLSGRAVKSTNAQVQVIKETDPLMYSLKSNKRKGMF